MSGSKFKVALVNTTTPLTGVCPTEGVVDFVGAGATNCYEGTAPAPAPSNTTSVQRLSNGCQDTDETLMTLLQIFRSLATLLQRHMSATRLLTQSGSSFRIC